MSPPIKNIILTLFLSGLLFSSAQAKPDHQTDSKTITIYELIESYPDADAQRYVITKGNPSIISTFGPGPELEVDIADRQDPAHDIDLSTSDLDDSETEGHSKVDSLSRP